MTTASFRASVYESTGYIPNYLMFGRENRMAIYLVYRPVPEENQNTYIDYVEDLKEKFTDAYELVREI